MRTKIAPFVADVKKPIGTRLSQRWYQGDQSWYYKSLWDINGQKIRVRIRSNAYDFQSYRVCEIFDPKTNRWNNLCSLPYAGMHSLPNLYVLPVERINPDLFMKDEAELLEEAKLILGD